MSDVAPVASSDVLAAIIQYASYLGTKSHACSQLSIGDLYMVVYRHFVYTQCEMSHPKNKTRHDNDREKLNMST